MRDPHSGGKSSMSAKVNNWQCCCPMIIELFNSISFTTGFSPSSKKQYRSGNPAFVGMLARSLFLNLLKETNPLSVKIRSNWPALSKKSWMACACMDCLGTILLFIKVENREVEDLRPA